MVLDFQFPVSVQHFVISKVIFEVQALPTIGHFLLHQLGILFNLVHYFCHLSGCKKGVKIIQLSANYWKIDMKQK